MQDEKKAAYIESLRNEISESADITRDGVVKVEEAYEAFLTEFVDLDTYIQAKKRDLGQKEGASRDNRSLSQQYHDLNTTITQYFSEGYLRDFKELKFFGKERFIKELDEARSIFQEDPDKLDRSRALDVSAGINSDVANWSRAVEDRAVPLIKCFDSSDRVVREMEGVVSYLEYYEPPSPVLLDIREVHSKFLAIREAASRVRNVSTIEDSPGMNAVLNGNKCARSLYNLVGTLYS